VGDARVGLVGFPSVGKSTLLTKITGTFSEAAGYGAHCRRMSPSPSFVTLFHLAFCLHVNRCCDSIAFAHNVPLLLQSLPR
jgi:ABC-type hemin transport system ATPase subunit